MQIRLCYLVLPLKEYIKQKNYKTELNRRNVKIK